MTQDEIIRMAREAGFNESGCAGIIGVEDFLERFAAIVAAHEREACAKVCLEQRNFEWPTASQPPLIKIEPSNVMAMKCAAAIRARGEK